MTVISFEGIHHARVLQAFYNCAILWPGEISLDEAKEMWLKKIYSPEGMGSRKNEIFMFEHVKGKHLGIGINPIAKTLHFADRYDKFCERPGWAQCVVRMLVAEKIVAKRIPAKSINFGQALEQDRMRGHKYAMAIHDEFIVEMPREDVAKFIVAYFSDNFPDLNYSYQEPYSLLRRTETCKKG